jgi:EmrB/QacA subfamily drug resistance transporter
MPYYSLPIPLFNPMFNITASNRKWWVLIATSSSLAMVFLDQSALPIALPTIQRELGLSAALLQWVVNAYLLALAVFIILGGKLGDRLGHRKIFSTGVIIFISSSILCALAPTGLWLVVSRVLQGVGGALMIPSSSPLFRTIVPANEFGKMVGLYVSIASIFLILGPTLGGFFSAYLNWRWIFWINFPVALISILITIFVIPKDVPHEKPEKFFDWLGFVTLSLSLICLVFALMQGATLGWTSTSIVSCFIVGFLALLIFVRCQLQHPTPFVDFALFKDVCISRCILTISVMQIVYISIIFWAMFMQYALHLPPQKAGIYLLSAQVPVLFFSTIAGKMLDRFGPRLPVSLGAGLIGIACLWIAIFSWQLQFKWLFPAFVLFGAASPLVSIGIMSTAISQAPAEKRGVVSGVLGAARQVGGSLGLAVLVALIMNITDRHILAWLQTNGSDFPGLHSEQLHALLVGTPLPASLHLSAAQITVAHTAIINAYTWGFSCIMFFVTLMAFCGVWVARKLPSIPQKDKKLT